MRIGMLTPSSNTVLEPMTARMCAPLRDTVSVHFSRFRVTRIAPDASSEEQFADAPMLEAARLLADAKVDVIVWNGTSGGWEGADRDRQLVHAIEDATKIPATTGTLATADALQAMNIKRYGLVVPYVDKITTSIRSTFASLGFECVASTNEGITDNWAFAQLPPALIAERCQTVAEKKPDGVLIFCTNLCGAPLVEELESQLQIPVLDSVAVCLWAAFHRLGSKPRIAGFGTLLASY
jgi:maleate isomerase